MDSINEILNTSDSDFSDNNGSDKKSFKNHKLIEQQAHALMAKLGRTPDADVFPFYCKVCYELSEAQTAIFLEIALTGRNPARYFSYLASKELGLGQFKND